MDLLPSAIGFSLVTASVLAVATVGFNLDLAVSEFLNIGFIVFLMIGQFATYLLLQTGLSIWVALFLGAVAAGCFAMLLNAFVIMPFKRRGSPKFILVLVTLTIASITSALLTMVFSTNSYGFAVPFSLLRGVTVWSMLFTRAQVIILVVSVACVATVDLVLRYTRLGREIRAIADDEDLARSAGTRVDFVINATWFLGGVLGGIAGSFLALDQANFTTTSDNSYFILIIAAAFFGGLGKPYGAALGALLVGLVIEVSAIWIPPELSSVVAFMLLILAIVFRPQGIIGRSREMMRA